MYSIYHRPPKPSSCNQPVTLEFETLEEVEAAVNELFPLVHWNLPEGVSYATVLEESPETVVNGRVRPQQGPGWGLVRLRTVSTLTGE